MPSYQAKNVIVSKTFGDAIVAAFSARPAAALLGATPKLRLGTDPGMVIDKTTTLADLAAQEANYSGYTAGGVTPTVTGPVNEGEDQVAAVVNNVFVATTASPFVGNTVCNWWIDDGTNLVVGETLDEADRVEIAEAGDFYDLLAVLPVSLRVEVAA